MEDWQTRTRRGLNRVEYCGCRSPTVYGKDAPTNGLACCQDLREYFLLVGPVLPELRATVQAHFTDVAGLGQQLFKKWELGLSLVRELRVESERGSDARCTPRQRRRARPCGGWYRPAGSASTVIALFDEGAC